MYADYRKAGYSKKFVAAHEDDLKLHKAAKEYFDHLGTKKLPSVKTLNAELQSLKDKNAQLYAKYKQARNQMQQSMAAKANLEFMLHMGTRTRKKRLAQENTR